MQGFKRYSSAKLKELVADLDIAKEAKEEAMSGILQVWMCGCPGRQGCVCV